MSVDLRMDSSSQWASSWRSSKSSTSTTGRNVRSKTRSKLDSSSSWRNSQTAPSSCSNTSRARKIKKSSKLDRRVIASLQSLPPGTKSKSTRGQLQLIRQPFFNRELRSCLSRIESWVTRLLEYRHRCREWRMNASRGLIQLEMRPSMNSSAYERDWWKHSSSSSRWTAKEFYKSITSKTHWLSKKTNWPIITRPRLHKQLRPTQHWRNLLLSVRKRIRRLKNSTPSLIDSRLKSKG